MKTIDLKSWNEYQPAIEKIKDEFGQHKAGGITLTNQVLYRGQTDANWPLKTTLERASELTWDISNYAREVLLCVPQIESFTGKEWNVTPLDQFDDVIEKNRDMRGGPYIPDYALWVYMRHHGFPSPLLDWTTSPYIAAFFAFADQSVAERASIFAYIESKMGVKGGVVGAPQITVQGPYVRTHKRHFLQQSWYTTCTSFVKGEYQFSSHEAVIAKEKKDQDILFKITLPRSDRPNVISALNDSNINYFSLFQTEEALMKTLGLKRIERIGL
jgi:hypothetical protein